MAQIFQNMDVSRYIHILKSLRHPFQHGGSMKFCQLLLVQKKINSTFSLSNLQYNSCTTTSILSINLIVLFSKIVTFSMQNFEPSYLITKLHVDPEVRNSTEFGKFHLYSKNSYLSMNLHADTEVRNSTDLTKFHSTRQSKKTLSIMSNVFSGKSVGFLTFESASRFGHYFSPLLSI